MIVEDLSELLLVLFELLRIFLHFSGFLAHFLDLIVKLLILSLEKGNFLLKVFDLSLKTHDGFTIRSLNEL